jgi:hypothetical protein
MLCVVKLFSLYIHNTYLIHNNVYRGSQADQSYVNDISDGTPTVVLDDTVQVTVKKSELPAEQVPESHVGKTFAEMEAELKKERESADPLPMPLSR